MAEPVWQFRLSVGNEPLFSVPVRTQGCQSFPNAHPWASHPIALTNPLIVIVNTIISGKMRVAPGHSERREYSAVRKRDIDVRRQRLGIGDKHRVVESALEQIVLLS